MIDLLLVPAALMIVLVMLHAWFGLGVLRRGIIFTDLAIAQFAALGSAISLGYFHEEHLYAFTLGFALVCALLIALASRRNVTLEAFIGLLYVLGASGIMLTLAHSAEGMEHFKSLLASDILFTPWRDVVAASGLYALIALAIWKLYPRTSGFMRDLLFFGLLALTVTSSVQLAGVLVVFVLLIAPALLATLQTRFAPLPFAYVYGWIFSIGGITLAYTLDLPTGYTVVFAAALLSTVAVLALAPKKR